LSIRVLHRYRKRPRTSQPCVPFHYRENFGRGAGCPVSPAANSASHIHHMLLQRKGLAAVSVLPEDRSQVAHCRQGFGMLIAELAATRRDDPFEEIARGLEVALGRDGSGKVVDRPKRLETSLAIEIVHPVHDVLLKLSRLFEFALSGLRDGQLADRLQCIKVALTQLATATGDHLLLELARCHQPTLCP